MSGLYPEEILVYTSWSFSEVSSNLSSLKEFNDVVRQYQIDEDDVWHPEEIVLNCPQVKVFHDRCETDDEEAMAEIILTADNGQSFTAGELLFKTHNAFASQLADLDHHFFEGFSLVESDMENSVPCYEVDLGS